MDLEEVKKRLAHIESIKDDDEAAHSAQDSLYEDVLVAISCGVGNHMELAKTALEVGKIDFQRWCA